MAACTATITALRRSVTGVVTLVRCGPWSRSPTLTILPFRSDDRVDRNRSGCGYPVAAAGDALLAPSVTRRIIAEFARRPAAPGRNGA
jgi:hypothetical protein